VSFWVLISRRQNIIVNMSEFENHMALYFVEMALVGKIERSQKTKQE
jgi:hypothetical protein